MRRSQALPAAFVLFFQGMALASVEAEHSTGAAFAFLGLYALLAATLYFVLLAGQRLGTVTGFVAAAALGFVLVWHARELTYRPGSLVLVPVLALAAAVPIWALSRADEGSWRRALAGAGAGLVLLGAAWLGVFHASPLLRWHLLRHHKMLGTPAYYLLARGVLDVQEELYERYRDEAGEPVPVPVPVPEPGPLPHLVFVLLDTLRADALETGGGPREAMPRLNAFLDGAWRFTDVVASSSWTRPSIASMMTGLLPEEHGARDVADPLAEGFLTLAEVYRGWGYETAAMVSNVGAVGRAAGFAQGFDLFHEPEADPYARAGQLRRTLEKWLLRRDADKPLFLYLHFLDPHEPYLAGRVPGAKTRAEYAAAYRAELAYLDNELAAVFELLEERLSGRRGVFVTSDHGEELFEHEEFGHGYSLYGEVVKIPAAFKTGTAGGELLQPLEGRDVFDLLVRWGGAGGRLDVAAWAAQRRRARRYYSIYYSSEGRLLLRPYLRRVCMRAVEDGGYKLVWSAYGSTVELYDLERDPGELRNLAAARPAVVERLLPLLDASASRWSFPAPYEPTPAELRQLINLGYVDD